MKSFAFMQGTKTEIVPKPAAPSGMEMVVTNLLARAGIDVQTIVKQATMAFEAVGSVDARLARLESGLDASRAETAALREELSLAIALLRRGDRDTEVADRPIEPRADSDLDGRG